MLISMLGFGNGIQKGVNDSMGGIATNAMWVWGEAATKPYNGFQPGRDINFYSEDVEAIRTTIEGVQYTVPEISLEDGAVVHRYAIMEEPAASTFMVMYRRYALSSRRHLYRDGPQSNGYRRKKVAVIGQGVEEELFEEGESAISKLIAIQESYFMVNDVTAQAGDGAGVISAVSRCH